MMSAYSLLTLSIVLILGEQGYAKLLDEECRPRYIPMISGGGAYANPSPHMAFITLNGDVMCVGSLISNSFVLTAKQCVLIEGKYSVILGRYEESTREQEETIPVASITPHSDKDIALLKLEREVEYKPTIKPICIIEDTAMESQLNTHSEFTVTGKVKNIRKQAVVLRMDASLCGPQINGYICVENPDHFSCEGDTGSPLGGDLKYNGETVFAQFGVLDGGSSKLCNRYTDVVKVTPWIVSTIQKINEEEDEGIMMKIWHYIMSIFR